MFLRKKGQSSAIMMIILELILLSLIGISLVGFVSQVVKMEDYKLKSTSREVALIFSSMYMMNDDVNLTYITPFNNKDYYIRADGTAVYVLKKDNEKLFPYVHSNLSKMKFKETRLIILNLLKTGNFFRGESSEESSN